MKRFQPYILIAVISLFLLDSCGKIETLSEVPSITFTSFTVVDTTDILGNMNKGGRLKFHFEDGDGDIGTEYDIETAEYLGVDSVNLFLSLYKKVDGVYALVGEDDILKPSDYRIPYIENEGQVKLLRGDITVAFLYQLYDVASDDTVKYEFYIKDRSDHVSNIETTCDIPLSHNAVYEK